MSIIEFLLISPGAVLGCVAGIGAAAGLNWLFPDQDLVFVQALLVAVGGVFGFILEGSLRNSKSK